MTLSENREYVRVKPFAPQHPRKTITTGGNSSMYPPTPPGFHSSSDTDGGSESPMDATEPQHARFSVFTARNGNSVTSISTIRLHPAPNNAYNANRYSSAASYSTRQSDESSYSGEYVNEYGGGNSANYRQQQVFQNTVSIERWFCMNPGN